jgi:DNA-binding response OmpR family regulator
MGRKVGIFEVYMSLHLPGLADRRRVVVADEDPNVVGFVIETLRADGHAVFHAYDVLAATQLAFALEPCHLVISNTKVEGVDGLELIETLRKELPALPILYLANVGRSTPELEAQLPPDVPILREPFTAKELRVAVAALLDGKAK